MKIEFSKKILIVVTSPYNAHYKYDDRIRISDKLYDLAGVTVHYGRERSGHYVAKIRDHNNGWICCNDSILYSTNVSNDDIVTLLLYSQREISI